jgi:REP-associated tyrosine transposase
VPLRACAITLGIDFTAAHAGWRRPSEVCGFAALGIEGVLFSLMPYRPRYYHPGHLQFITASTYRRVPLFQSPRFCRLFVRVLKEVRREFGFLLLGWVRMPEHFHLLIQPNPADSTSRILQQLKQRTAFHILKALRQNSRSPWCRRMLSRLRLPETVHDQAQYRVWQRRFYPFNVFSEKKRLEKLNYMHGNPVERRLVDSPDQWAWSSFKFYYLDDASVLRMDRLP